MTPRDGQRWWGSSRIQAVVCIAAVVLSAWWAFSPLGGVERSTPVLEEQNESRQSTPRATLDLAAFRTPLWVAPLIPPQDPDPEPPPQRQPLRFELLAVVGQDGSYRAVLYDPDADRLVVVAQGESIDQGRVVERVTASGVRIRDDSGVRTLALRQDGETP